jgi:hypothetical protein
MIVDITFMAIKYIIIYQNDVKNTIEHRTNKSLVHIILVVVPIFVIIILFTRITRSHGPQTAVVGFAILARSFFTQVSSKVMVD